VSGKSIRARAPAASSAATRQVMQAVLQRDTTPEVKLRRALHMAGFRFRKDCRPELALRCKADVVFRRQKVCVFVDGCFWHRCPVHFELPKANTAWWDEKIQATVDRDVKQTRLLESLGWRVLRVWEHDLVGDALPRVVTLVATGVRAAATPGTRPS
jgi:DNA mismatch endonuclease (patch repair protein)